MPAATPLSQPILTLDKTLFADAKALKDARNNFSAIVLEGAHLWLGGDEGTQIDRLTRQADGSFAGQSRFDVAPLLDLPGGAGPKAPEIDIEGLDFDDGYLWIIGSHSRKRPKVDKNKTDEENLARMAEVRTDGNRFTLGRFPLSDQGVPVAERDSRRAARLEGGTEGNVLLDALRADSMLGPFCQIPSKENGLDLEGLAVRGNRVFAGLRGPVLRGWAVVLDFEVEVYPGSPGRLKLSRPPWKHLLKLDGLGVRELALLDKDLLILAGPTMDLDGPVTVYRWVGAVEKTGASLNPEVAKVLDVPFAQGADHAEGIALIVRGATGSLQAMICYDSPHASRTPAPDKLVLDVFAL